MGLVLIAVPAVLPARISEVNGAKLWIRVSGFSVQPGELAKVALTIFFAAYLVNKRELLASAGRRILRCDIPRGRDLGPLLVVWTLSVLVLVTQKDLGMALLLFTVFLTCLYISTARMGWLVIGTALLVVVVVGAYYTLPHVHTRIAVWLDPFAYPDSGYQMQQSLFSFGTGGILGTGLGAGHPDLVPLARTDFIVAAFGEETGLFGITAIILCYVLVVSRGLRIAQLTRDSFGQLLAAGLTFTLGFQVFIIIAGVSNLLPETGLATPLCPVAAPRCSPTLPPSRFCYESPTAPTRRHGRRHLVDRQRPERLRAAISGGMSRRQTPKSCLSTLTYAPCDRGAEHASRPPRGAVTAAATSPERVVGPD